MPLSTGQILHNRYRIVKLLGQGGFGAVYRAWDMNLNMPVALKENLNTSAGSVRQFTTEARLLASLRHPNLPYVIDHFFLADQGQYLVMEFIEGQDLQDMLNESATGLPEAQVIPWIEQISDALTYLHSQSPPIIHRDIKPANLKVGSQDQIRLVDFGVSKQFNPQKQTTVGARAVTFGYSPPEQYGHGITDARSDVYALAATLYAMLTGHIPPESLQLRMGEVLQTPRQLNPAISLKTDRAILRAMSLSPAQRFQSVAEFKAALAKPAPAVSPPIVQTPARRGRAQFEAGTVKMATPVSPPPVQPVQSPRPAPFRAARPKPKPAPPPPGARTHSRLDGNGRRRFFSPMPDCWRRLGVGILLLFL
ncbi:serine/threonine-protein kinase [Chloroflexota bacterium]